MEKSNIQCRAEEQSDDEIPQFKQSLPDLSGALVKAYYTLKRCIYLMCMGALSTCMSVHPVLVEPEESLELESQTMERHHIGAEK